MLPTATRSVVYSTNGMVALTQPLATDAGLKVLAAGGNCVDAAVAVLAALCVTEPGSTGVGGDCFALYYNSELGKVEGLNGCGRAPSAVDVDEVRALVAHTATPKRIPIELVHAVTVPGAIAGWVDAVTKWGLGEVLMAQILQPAIDLAERGFPVLRISSVMWKQAEGKILAANPDDRKGAPLLADGRAPDEGEVVQNQLLADTLRLVAQHGKSGFYEGAVADAIVSELAARGGVLSHADLSSHTLTFVDPICVAYKGKHVWEIPPNGQGLVALLAMGFIRELELEGRVDFGLLEHNSAEYLHVLIESLKLAFLDLDTHVLDPTFGAVPTSELLGQKYLAARVQLFKADRVLGRDELAEQVPNPQFKSDTVYFTVADGSGSACLFINSVYELFGLAIIPKGTGFCLQNRGCNFNLTDGLRNCLAPGKRPYHTIIPGMITEESSGSLFCSFGNMGGYMQPAGHVQHVLNMLQYGMSPQQSVDAPRFCLVSHTKQRHLDSGQGADGPVLTPITVVAVEETMPAETVEGLRRLGHEVKVVGGDARMLFGRAQIIQRTGAVWAGGSDVRGDGAAVPFV